jgi:hypothetical protein
MMLTATYVTFSELFDRVPTKGELLAVVGTLNRERALLILIRMNMALRHVLDDDRQRFGRLQAMLAATFCDDETLQRYRTRFAFNRPEEKPLFLPIHCLNVLRLIITEEDGLVTVEEDTKLQHLLGKACLIMANILFTKEERQQIEQQNSEAKRLSLLVQMLAPFEISNPVSSHRMVLRYQRLYRTVLQMPNVRNRIRTECNLFDFDEVFKELTGVSLQRWLHSIFVTHGYFSQSANPWSPNDTYFLIDPNIFAGSSDFSKAEIDSILTTISTSIEDFKIALSSENRTDPRFDFIPFRTKPLIRLSNNKLACLDLAFLIDQVHTGVHWIMHDRLSRFKRNALFKAWGVLFEEYLHYLFEGMDTKLPIRYFRAPRWTKGTKDNIEQESFDAIMAKNTVFFPMEFKGGFLSRNARYSADVNVFTSEMREKFGGPQQLAWKIGTLFSANEQNRSAIEHINVDAYEVVVPILVLHDHILQVPLLNWWLNLEFQRAMSNYELRPGIRVEALNVATIREIEAMVNSAETSNFDFLYALHHRAVRDPEMVSHLFNFLFEFPDFGKGNSKRTQAVLEDFHKELWRTVFPNESLLEPGP